MPLALARFPHDVHPSGFIGTDGRLYVTLAGVSTTLASLAPSLVVSLSTVGGVGHAHGVQLAAVVWILGRAIVFGADIHSLHVANYIVDVDWLGGVLDAVC